MATFSRSAARRSRSSVSRLNANNSFAEQCKTAPARPEHANPYNIRTRRR
jgi:hypothetical protein